jgi:oligoribonuclease NrnB/cAMP/cGMP phosphodiesterase (DHH superfamily)
MQELAKVHKDVIVRDHHKTAAERFMPGFNSRMLTHLEGNLDVHFDMEKSGALMAWEYFRPNLPIPQIIQAVSDRDLWTFKLNGTKEIHSVLVSRPMTIESFEKSFEDVEFTRFEVIREGAALLRLQDQIVQNIIKNSWIQTYHGHTVAMVNASSHWSEVGHAMLEKYGETIDFAVSYTDLPGGTRMYSLRSTGFDVAKFSEQFKGGGHKTAAGYKLPSPKGE